MRNGNPNGRSSPRLKLKPFFAPTWPRSLSRQHRTGAENNPRRLKTNGAGRPIFRRRSFARQEEAPCKGEYGSLVLGFRRFGEGVSPLGRLATLYGRRCDQPAGCKLVNVPRQHREFFGKIALLPRIEHAEHFGDRSAIVGRREGRIGPDAEGRHENGFRIRAIARTLGRATALKRNCRLGQLARTRINSCSNTFVPNA